MDSIDIGQAITYLTVIVLACFAGAVEIKSQPISIALSEVKK